MSDPDVDFRYSHKREHERIEGRKFKGAGIAIMIASVFAPLIAPPGAGWIFFLVVLGLGVFFLVSGSIQEWSARD